jgi:hypothetical protein
LNLGVVQVALSRLVLHPTVLSVRNVDIFRN